MGPVPTAKVTFGEVNSCRVREEKCGGGNVTRRESRNSIQKIGVSLAEMRARTESALKQGARCYKKDAIRRQVPNGGFIGMGTTQCAALACGKYGKSAAEIEKPAAASALQVSRLRSAGWSILNGSSCSPGDSQIASAKSLHSQSSSTSEESSNTSACRAATHCPTNAGREPGIAGHVSPRSPSAGGVAMRPQIHAGGSATANEQTLHHAAIAAGRQNSNAGSDRRARHNRRQVFMTLRNTL